MLNKFAAVETNCSQCGAGRYQDVPGLETCRQCPTGYYQDQIGIPYCVGCLPGRYQNERGMPLCKDCAQDTASLLEKRNASCDVCAAGRTAKNGSLVCSECLAGQYEEATASGDKICSVCLPGNYTDASNMVACKRCPIGFSQSEKGQTSCTKCSP